MPYPHPRARFCCGKCAADHAVGFFSHLRHSIGEWADQPFVLEPWQEHDIIRPVFGTLLDNGLRQYQKVYIEIPCKNGKSTLSAGVALYLLCADGEKTPHIAGAAVDKKQAAQIFDECVRMVGMSAALRKSCHWYRPPHRTLEYVPNNGKYEVLAADGFRAEGLNLNGAIFDELHVQKNRDLYDTLGQRMDARAQPLYWMITTAGFDRQSICWEVHNYAAQIISGKTGNPSFFAYIKAAPEEADWTDEDLWFEVNPGLGTFKSLEKMRDRCREAMDIPAKQNVFRRYDLNQWRWADVNLFDMMEWMATEGEVSESALEGLECYGGLDLAEKVDMAAFCLRFKVGASIKALWWYWYPAENIRERSRQVHATLDLWAEQGWIKLTEGNVMDFDVIRNDIVEISKRFKIKEIGFDPWKATQMSEQLQKAGLRMREVRQGHQSLAEPTADLLRAIKAHEYHHGHNPVTTWMADNTVGRPDENKNVIPSRKKSTSKIDGIMAALMAEFVAGKSKLKPNPYNQEREQEEPPADD